MSGNGVHQDLRQSFNRPVHLPLQGELYCPSR
jgi:hypothetical protein